MDKHVKREKEIKDQYYSDWKIDGEDTQNPLEETKSDITEPSTRGEDFLGKRSSKK